MSYFTCIRGQGREIVYEETWYKNTDIFYTQIIEQHIENTQKEWKKNKFEYPDAIHCIQVKSGLKSSLWGS